MLSKCVLIVSDTNVDDGLYTYYGFLPSPGVYLPGPTSLSTCILNLLIWSFPHWAPLPWPKPPGISYFPGPLSCSNYFGSFCWGISLLAVRDVTLFGIVGFLLFLFISLIWWSADEFNDDLSSLLFLLVNIAEVCWGVYEPGPGTSEYLPSNLSLVDLKGTVPVELILTIMLWLFERVWMSG